MPENPVICGLILAAGMSSRMGAFKPLMPLRGKTMIENTVDSVLDGGAKQVVVVTGYRGEELEQVLRRRYGAELILARNPDFCKTDMMESIRIGCGLRRVFLNAGGYAGHSPDNISKAAVGTPGGPHEHRIPHSGWIPQASPAGGRQAHPGDSRVSRRRRASPALAAAHGADLHSPRR